MLSTLGPEGSSRLRDNPQRLKEVNADVEAMGVKVLAQYALLGMYDFLNILEAPDEVTMAKVATTLASRGTLKTLTLTAIEVDDFIDSLGSTAPRQVHKRDQASRQLRTTTSRLSALRGAWSARNTAGEQRRIGSATQPVADVGDLDHLTVPSRIHDRSKPVRTSTRVPSSEPGARLRDPGLVRPSA